MPRQPAQAQPQQHLDADIADPPPHLAQHAPAVGGRGRLLREQRHGVAAREISQLGGWQHLQEDAEGDADGGKGVVDEYPPTVRQECRPAQVVGERPVVVLAVDVEQIDVPGPPRPQPRAELGFEGDDILDPRVAHVALELLAGGRPAEQAAVDERVDADQRAERARRARPSTTVERPWWLPISSTVAPSGRAMTASNSIRAWPSLSQPGTVCATDHASSNSSSGAPEGGSCGREVMWRPFARTFGGTGLDCPRQATTR